MISTTPTDRYYDNSFQVGCVPINQKKMAISNQQTHQTLENKKKEETLTSFRKWSPPFFQWEQFFACSFLVLFNFACRGNHDRVVVVFFFFFYIIVCVQEKKKLKKSVEIPRLTWTILKTNR